MSITEKEIFEKYSRFIKPEKSMTESLMCFGIECDTGWYSIIDSFLEKVSKLKDIPENFEIVQIKEKYATLRIHTSMPLTDEIYSLIDEAEEESANTCEICGEQGGLHKRGNWYKTLCDAHAFVLMLKPFKNNPHHVEFHTQQEDVLNKDMKDRDKAVSVLIDGTKMPDEYIAEMIADWCAMAEEKGNTPKEWADKMVNKKWKFTENQVNLIYELIDSIW